MKENKMSQNVESVENQMPKLSIFDGAVMAILGSSCIAAAMDDSFFWFLFYASGLLLSKGFRVMPPWDKKVWVVGLSGLFAVFLFRHPEIAFGSNLGGYLGYAFAS